MNNYDDPNAYGNSPKWHTGEKCIVPGCDKPAGTQWGKFWCFEHNVERIRDITAILEGLFPEENSGEPKQPYDHPR